MLCDSWTVVGSWVDCFLFPIARLAKLTAAVLLAKDVPVYFFSTYVPTPFVVSHLHFHSVEPCIKGFSPCLIFLKLFQCAVGSLF